MSGPETVRFGNERNNDRYAGLGLGLKYDLGAFSTGLVVDTVLNSNTNGYANTEDTLGVTWGASYDFNVAKLYGFAQYGTNENKFGSFSVADVKENGFTVTNSQGLDGYPLGLGLTAPVAAGTLYALATYLDGEFGVGLVHKFQPPDLLGAAALREKPRRPLMKSQSPRDLTVPGALSLCRPQYRSGRRGNRPLRPQAAAAAH